MGQRRPPEPPASDDRAARPAWSPSLGLLAIALGIVAGALGWWWSSEPAMSTSAAPAPASPPPAAAVQPVLPAAPVPVAPPVAPTAPPAAAAAPLAPAAPVARVARQRDPDGDQTPDLSDYVNPGERPTMGQVIERLHQAGVHTGLGAFNPPGTRPPLVGLAVPEDFVLPDGYVRHYQATDDGQRIEPILMFAPDRPVFDAAGRPVAVPPDRVVPPELAPPGMPLRRIAIPAPLEPGRPRS